MFKKITFLIFVVFSLNNISAFAAPSVTSLTDNRADYFGNQIPKYEKFELTFTLDSTYSNPYNYDTATGGVDIKAYFTNPNSSIDTVNAFWFQNYVRSRGTNQTEVLNTTGVPCWKIRYAPDTTGLFNYTIILNDSISGYCTLLVDSTFTAVSSSNKGFIKVNPKITSILRLVIIVYFMGLART